MTNVVQPKVDPQPRMGPPTKDRRINWVISNAPLPLAQNLDGQDLTARIPPLVPPPNTAAQVREEPEILNIEDHVPPHGLEIPEMLARLKALTPDGDTLVTKIKDPPLFMFSSIIGKNGDVLIFYDGGNSHCLFRKGVPRDLWGTLMKRGPHPLGAVGATTVYGGDSWACQPRTTKGKR